MILKDAILIPTSDKGMTLLAWEKRRGRYQHSVLMEEKTAKEILMYRDFYYKHVARVKKPKETDSMQQSKARERDLRILSACDACQFDLF